MITIHNLEVHFEVEGNDTQRFAELFARFIRQWSAESEARQSHERRAERDRSLGDAPARGSYE